MSPERAAVELVAHVDLVVAAIRAEAECADQPAPPRHPALLHQGPVECQRALPDLVVGARLLPDPVDVDLERWPYSGRQPDSPAFHRPIMARGGAGAPRRLGGHDGRHPPPALTAPPRPSGERHRRPEDGTRGGAG